MDLESTYDDCEIESQSAFRGSSKSRSNDSKKNRRTSKIWDDFQLVESPSKKKKVKCKHCGRTYDAESVAGTSNLKRHLEKCPSRPKHTDSSIGKKLDQQIYRELLAKAIIRHGYAFTFVEHEGTRDVFSFLNNDIQHVTRNTIRADCLKLHKKMKHQLKSTLQNIPGRICLTSDMWTSCTDRGFLCLTAHYVNENWMLCSTIINFCHVPPPHNANFLCSTISNLLRDWGIEKKIFSITLDNARNMDNMQDLLRNKLVQQDALLSHGAFFHIRCYAHILNLIVQNGLQVLGDSLAKVRYCIKYVEGSEARMIKFKECARQADLDQSKGLWLDVATRWNSTYMMLERFLYYVNAFKLLPTEDPNFLIGYLPTEEELLKFERISKFLEPFYDITTLFSGSEYPTSNLYFENVCRVQSNLLKEIEEPWSCLHQMAIAMKGKFDKYWNELCVVLAFGVILDPRFKFKYVRFLLKEFDGDYESKANGFLEQLKKLFKEYEKTRILNPSEATSVYQGSVRELTEYHLAFERDDFDEDSTSSNKSQLELYLCEPRVPISTPSFDVLHFWRDYQTRYPELAAMARDILSIPITTVASESAFSIGGRILNKWRSSLTVQTAEVLVTTRNWLWGYEVEQDNMDQDQEIALAMTSSLSIRSEEASNVMND